MRGISEPETEFITADDYREEPNSLEETDAFLNHESTKRIVYQPK